MHLLQRLIIVAMIASLGQVARAEESLTDSPGEVHTQLDPDETHPFYSTSYRWVSSVLIGAGGLLLAAIVTGPMVKAEAPDAVPPAMSHEEDPAADRH